MKPRYLLWVFVLGGVIGILGALTGSVDGVIGAIKFGLGGFLFGGVIGLFAAFLEGSPRNKMTGEDYWKIELGEGPPKIEMK